MILLILISFILLSGCQPSPKEHQYKEVATEILSQGTSDPHAGMDIPSDHQQFSNMGQNVTPEAKAALEKMIAQGQDPHAGLDFSNSSMGENPHAGMDMSSMTLPGMDQMPAESLWDWQTPSGWKQLSGKGLRLATFQLVSNPKSIDCSIINLGGMAGGLESNIRRWMGQIGLEASQEDFDRFIKSVPTLKTQGQQEAQIYDFTLLQEKARSDAKSMLAAIMATDEATLFIKMTGNKKDIKNNKESFLQLVQSIKPH